MTSLRDQPRRASAATTALSWSVLYSLGMGGGRGSIHKRHNVFQYNAATGADAAATADVRCG